MTKYHTCSSTREHRKAYARDRSRKHREMVGFIKVEMGCEVCGYDKSPFALQLAHRDRTEKTYKKNNTAALNYQWKWERIMAEMEKCRVLCANCHAEETAIEEGW